MEEPFEDVDERRASPARTAAVLALVLVLVVGAAVTFDAIEPEPEDELDVDELPGEAGPTAAPTPSTDAADDDGDDDPDPALVLERWVRAGIPVLASEAPGARLAMTVADDRVFAVRERSAWALDPSFILWTRLNDVPAQPGTNATRQLVTLDGTPLVVDTKRPLPDEPSGERDRSWSVGLATTSPWVSEPTPPVGAVLGAVDGALLVQQRPLGAPMPTGRFLTWTPGATTDLPEPPEPFLATWVVDTPTGFVLGGRRTTQPFDGSISGDLLIWDDAEGAWTVAPRSPLDGVVGDPGGWLAGPTEAGRLVIGGVDLLGSRALATLDLAAPTSWTQQALQRAAPDATDPGAAEAGAGGREDGPGADAPAVVDPIALAIEEDRPVVHLHVGGADPSMLTVDLRTGAVVEGPVVRTELQPRLEILAGHLVLLDVDAAGTTPGRLWTTALPTAGEAR